MPDLASHPSSRIVKMLLIGDPGSGKTGSLASLADAGYNVRIIDLDNGLDILKNLLTDPKSPYKPDSASRIKYVTITERVMKISTQGGIEVPLSATVWNRLVGTLTNWKNKDEDLGPVSSWTEKDVLVIDSLTLAGIAAYNFAATQRPAGGKDNRMVYYYAQSYLEYLMQCLYADDIKCNVVVNSHITFLEGENDMSAGYPTTIGSKLSPKIGRYFNSVLMMKSVGKQHRLHTIPAGVKVELKSSAPLRVKDTYDIKYGLAEYFRDVKGEGASAPNVVKIA